MEKAHHTGYGVKNGRLIHISETAKGLACGCICVVCGHPLIARKGGQRRHHYAHKTNIDCQGAAETALHLLSKELLGDLNYIVLPPYVFFKERKTKTGVIVRHQQKIAKGGTAPIKGALIESRETGFIPDAVLDCGIKKLIVEIAVTHKVDRSKMRHIRRRDLPAIEVRLDFSDALLSRDELRDKLQNDMQSKFWLFHPAQREEERAFFLKLRQNRKYNRKTQTVVAALAPRQHTTSLYVPQPKFNPSEYDKTAEEFNRKHKRYPTIEECFRLWPDLYPPVAKKT